MALPRNRRNYDDDDGDNDREANRPRNPKKDGDEEDDSMVDTSYLPPGVTLVLAPPDEVSQRHIALFIVRSRQARAAALAA